MGHMHFLMVNNFDSVGCTGSVHSPPPDVPGCGIAFCQCMFVVLSVCLI